MSEQTARIRCSSAAIALSKMPPDAPPETVKALIGEMRDALDEYRTAILGSQAALGGCYRTWALRQQHNKFGDLFTGDCTSMKADPCPYCAREAAERPLVAQLEEALRGLLTRIEAAHIDDWKEHNVDWFAIERGNDALAAADAQKPALTPQEER